MHATIPWAGRAIAVAVVTAGCALGTMSSLVQAAQPAVPPPVVTPKSAAQSDLTGYWVSVVTEDWMLRMVVPPKGDIGSVPANAAGKKATAEWDSTRDAAAGETCKAYGAAGIIRRPGRLHITWADDRNLRLDFDAGSQTRLLHFSEKLPPTGYSESEAPTALFTSIKYGEPTLSGYSAAAWHKQVQNRGMGPTAETVKMDRGGSLAVVTANMKPGYLQTNGVPYSKDAILREFYEVIELPGGARMLIVTSILEDPAYLTEPFVTSTQFRLEPDGSKWDPSTC